MWKNPQETADLVTFTEEILTGKLHFLRSDWHPGKATSFNLAPSKTQTYSYSFHATEYPDVRMSDYVNQTVQVDIVDTTQSWHS